MADQLPNGDAGGPNRLARRLKTSVITRAITKTKRWIRSAPIAQFYLYMWRRDRGLLALNVLTNYVLPLLMEMLPWYLCVRRISKQLRLTRTGIEHDLVLGRGLNSRRIAALAGMTVLYAMLHNLMEVLRNRNHLGSQLLTRRLVLEKILFSEIGAVEKRYEEVFGEAVRPEDMEEHVFKDVSDTVVLFEVTIPSIIRGLAELARECYELYAIKEKIDVVALARPFVINTFLEAINLARWHFIEEKQEMLRLRNRLRMTKAISNMCEGLTDVQVNNIQGYQLSVIDRLISKEVEGRQGWKKYLSLVYETVDNRSLVDFVTETYLANWVMRTRNISHETFINIRNEILHVVMAGSRLWKQCKRAAYVMEAQHRVVQLLDLEMFSSEAKLQKVKALRPETFKSCEIKSVYFNYKTEGLAASSSLRGGIGVASSELHANIKVSNSIIGGESNVDRKILEENDEAKVQERDQDQLRIGGGANMLIERGKTYLIVGRNRSGKSTLMKVLCQILRPKRMKILFNGRPFEEVERVHLRQMLSYVAQRPFIFEGTIAQNIALGRAAVDSSQVDYAAQQAGVYMSELPRDTKGKDGDPHSLSRRRRRAYRPWARRPALLQWLGKRVWELARHGTRALREFTNTSPLEGMIPDSSDSIFQPLVSTHTRQALARCAMVAQKDQNNIKKKNILSGNRDSITGQSSNRGKNAEDNVGGLKHSESKTLGAEDRRKILQMRTSTRGNNLSGGFAQSVAVARVFLRPESQIVILDEAMSQMDTVKRNTHVLPRLFSFVRKHNQTLILVSHDVPTIASKVDRVFVMNQGRCVEQGSHSELVEKRAPAYMRLLDGGEDKDSEYEDMGRDR